MKITIEKRIQAPVEAVWRAWTTPADIVQWNTASADWHTTKATVDLRVGGLVATRDPHPDPLLARRKASHGTPPG